MRIMGMHMGTATEDSNENHATVRLVIDTKANKVMFAEGGKDFVDFLFTLLFLRLANIIRLISVDDMVGCIGNLYDSFQKLDDTCVLPHMRALRSNSNKCSSCRQASWASCPPTWNQTGGSDSGGGLVDGHVNYTITDDLKIKPASGIWSLEAFSKIGAREVRTVSIGINEGEKILNASFQTKNVLSHIFLRK